jgi:hypothetical protein
VAGERSRVEDDDRAEATRALREMLSAGKLTKLMPMKVEGGRIETVSIEQEGPIAYIESTTLSQIFDEDANRCVILHTDEQKSQTEQIIKSIAKRFGGGRTSGGADGPMQRHHTLQRMLESLPVVIPYANRVGELFIADRVEARRLFPQLMSMIASVALLHQRQREKNADGCLIATADDYNLAYGLLAGPMGRVLGGGVSEAARRFYDRLGGWWPAPNSFTTSEAKKNESSSRSSVYGWLRDLADAGYVEQVAESRGRSAATWRLATTMPGETNPAGLPAPEAIFPGMDWTDGYNL